MIHLIHLNTSVNIDFYVGHPSYFPLFLQLSGTGPEKSYLFDELVCKVSPYNIR